jgi:hypothetical protein
MTTVMTPDPKAAAAPTEQAEAPVPPAARKGYGWVSTVSNILAVVFVVVALLPGYLSAPAG